MEVGGTPVTRDRHFGHVEQIETMVLDNYFFLIFALIVPILSPFRAQYRYGPPALERNPAELRAQANNEPWWFFVSRF